MKKTERIEQICIISVCLIVAALLIWFTVCSAAYAETTATGKGAIDLTGLFNAAIAVLGALVTYRLLPWLRARTTQSQQEGLYACAKTLVYAAEQLYRTGRIQNRLTYVCEELQKRGYTADREAIEAAVTQLRSDTCAYLKDLEIANVTEVDYEQNGGMDSPAPQAHAPVSPVAAEEANGIHKSENRAGKARADSGGEENEEADEESEAEK